jgi:hypothetical protein
MKHTIQVRITRGERQYVAECLDLPVVTQAPTLDELAANIQEAFLFTWMAKIWPNSVFRAVRRYSRPWNSKPLPDAGIAKSVWARCFEDSWRIWV